MLKWAIIVAGIVANVSASLLVKVAMSAPWPAPDLQRPLELLRNLPLVGGVLLYGAAFVLYAAALARLPLNVAHPVLTAGAIAGVALVSAMTLREPMPPLTALGIGLVLCGVVLISRSQA